MLNWLKGLFGGGFQGDRSSRWPKVRAEHLKVQPFCQACGGTTSLEVHHKYPVGWPGGKDMELDFKNLITLCEAPSRNCHLWFGHLGHYASYNRDVERDCFAWRAKVKNRPVQRKAGGAEEAPADRVGPAG